MGALRFKDETMDKYLMLLTKMSGVAYDVRANIINSSIRSILENALTIAQRFDVPYFSLTSLREDEVKTIDLRISEIERGLKNDGTRFTINLRENEKEYDIPKLFERKPKEFEFTIHPTVNLYISRG